jgi:hypothetical protein
MMADDAEADEEIERQLEADAHDRDYHEQPLLDDKELDVNNKNNFSRKKPVFLLVYFSFLMILIFNFFH